ncbi:peptide deformylase [Bacillus sp. B1-b2]|uniref:peptide deformylase n=1 Tax=Bacillus sp. B1-b2 TaxID=2653201 RepID=UPI001261FB0D|nr:peptide deformylase [Bacillus sp. B1-b2]KAB7669313.1 peptide deformylase [Bacillus sp. B1-b2]
MLTMEDIIRDGHPCLREVAKEVNIPASEEDKKILKSMMDYLINSQDPELAEKYNLRGGVGLAAPQINISKRMIAVHVKDLDGSQYSYALLNPKIISHSVEKSYLTTGEGCLSVDESIPGFVVRYARITVKGLDIDGNVIKIRLKGLPAIVFQHEIDHLNGIMFYDHINESDPFAITEDIIPIER